MHAGPGGNSAGRAGTCLRLGGDRVVKLGLVVEVVPEAVEPRQHVVHPRGEARVVRTDRLLPAAVVGPPSALGQQRPPQLGIAAQGRDLLRGWCGLSL